MAVTINDFTAGVVIRESQSSGKLTIYSLFDGTDGAGEDQKLSDYLLLEEALDGGLFTIEEVSEAGDVNAVFVSNMTGKPVLILDGEEIVGAKQNRMVNASILVAADKKTEVPVSCVERGRWNYKTDKFAKSDAFGYSTLRRQKAEQVSHSLHARQGFAADQGAIWQEIDRAQASMGTSSPTDALHETYDNYDEEIYKMTEDLKALPGQIGLAVYINNRFVCLDLFDKPQTLEKLWSRLLRSYAMEALNTKGRSSSSPRPAPEKIIEGIDQSEYLTYPSVGLGRDLRFKGQGVVGAGLILDEQIVHLSVFGEESDGHRGNISSPHRRRRNMG